jgi:hypothetical protein
MKNLANPDDVFRHKNGTKKRGCNLFILKELFSRFLELFGDRLFPGLIASPGQTTN